MNLVEFARKLVESPAESRQLILLAQPASPAQMAAALQEICYEAWTHDPQKVASVVDVLDELATVSGEKVVSAYASWARGISCLVDGRLESAIERINESEAVFMSLEMTGLAAGTQTGKLYALAMLGRYEEAVQCGVSAREIFVEHNDQYSAGKIEHNIGNLFWRRDLYRESEPFLESAHQRFTLIGDQRQLAMVENCQAFVHSLQNRFRDAERLYSQALTRAESLGLTVTAAEIETGLSNLYLLEGKYDLALKYMECSRQKYDSLGMPAQSVNCELEIADIYLELNLLNEATACYGRCEKNYTELGMQAELARCLKNQAVALFRSGQIATAQQKLELAEVLFDREGNDVSLASVNLAKAAIELDLGEFELAEANVKTALDAFRRGENFRLELNARWLLGEIMRSSGRDAESLLELQNTLQAATGNSRQVEYLCRTSIGRLTKDPTHFEAAVEIVELSRSSLNCDELRTSFFADRLLPYEGLVEICLAERDYLSAFRWHERSRGRSLADGVRPHDDTESSKQMLVIREELNWLHARLNRSSLSGAEERKQIGELRQLTARRENEYAELRRRTFSSNETAMSSGTNVDIPRLQEQLGDSTFVEFASIAGRITAFIVTSDGFEAVANYADENKINELIRQYLFQLNTGRIIDRLSPASRRMAQERADRIGHLLYQELLGPLGNLTEKGQLILSPAGMMHRLPFGALMKDGRYLTESQIVSYAPSASILSRCLEMASADTRSALVIGVPSITTPLVAAEIEAVSSYFEKHQLLFGSDATVEGVKANILGSGVIHLACHGKYRADNPRFSSLVLDCEELFANDIEDLPLAGCLVVLSSCDSGINEIVRGEEMIGLTRSFFAAGAGSLVMSLWRVNDGITTKLMTSFYRHLRAGNGVQSSLRSSQLELLDGGLHPYFWTPFIVSGRP
ncbi:MAG: CHAT domain-containing protein [Chloracidobacterium sp.]|nr:CHAT domain-containing protein [Chloracidobacterium sp.]